MSTETLKYEINFQKMPDGVKVWVTEDARYVGDGIEENHHRALRLGSGIILVDLRRGSFVASN